MTDEDGTYRIIATRFANGEPVGEGYLYGRAACEMISRRLVTKEVIEAYRSGAFLSRRGIYGQEAALKWEADAKGNHETARAVHGANKESPERTRHNFTPRPNGFREQHADA